jgi:hypothetical protein
MRWRALLLAALSATALGALPSGAAAAAGPTAVRLEGPGFPGLSVGIASDPELFHDLVAQVAWVSSRPGEAPAPRAEALGPGYRLVVFVDGTPHQTYDLYPLAVGGPRVFRPAAQPNRLVAEAWFFGRLSMPDVLARAGVPLPPSTSAQPIADGHDGRWMADGRGGQPAGDASGTGDGTAVVAEPGEPGVVPVAPTAAPVTDMDEVLRQWRWGMLLVGAGGLALLLLLGAVALLTHDR